MAKRGTFFRGTAPLCSMLALGLLLCAGACSFGASPAASSSRQTREEAIQGIPFDRLAPAYRSKVQNTISKCCIFRRMPVQVNECDPDMYEFLLRHPEVVVNIWETMGVSKITLKRTGENIYAADDGSGTHGKMVVMRIAHDLIVAYCEGTYDGPLVEKPLAATCVLVLRSGSVLETNGRYYVTSRLDSFIQFDSIGIELLAKTFSPLITKTSDYNFQETCAFAGNLSRTAESNPAAVIRIASRLPDVDDETRSEFVDVCNRLSDKSGRVTAERLAANVSPANRPSKKRTR